MTPLVTVTNGAGQDLSIRSDVLAGIQQASLSTGVEFSYLMAQANRESSFNPAAQARTSSAAGLYQFVEQTWLGVVKNHGAEYGQGDLADKIARRSDGHYTVTDAATRREILDLRRDPGFAAAMAAEHAADNKAKLEEKLDRDITGTDLYMAHFLGISGALKFLRTMEESPDRTGASLFPKAAAANKNVFYTENGRAKTVSEIYDTFAKSMNADMAAYASLEGDTTPASLTDTALVADSGVNSDAAIALVTSLPASPNAAFFGNFRTVSSADTRTADAANSGGFGKVGSLLSPLMLVTLAALPVGNEEEGEIDDRKSAARVGNATQNGSLFNRLDDPLHLDLLRSSAAI
ncbi:transglycosylase SLT domain-containing protein [Dongia sp.]|uniref:transglycosylase SLT domain-containing protein n=1 Tax=Dongia sp. TaxID=1977262 RepID=UPI0035B42638